MSNRTAKRKALAKKIASGSELNKKVKGAREATPNKPFHKGMANC